jgi:predicted RNA binding protein YcfA (HicA-like mRNA interferase family)
LNYGEFSRKLGRLGVEFRRQARGSHEIWWRPDTGAYASIPNHGAREIKRGMVRGILRDLGLSEEDLAGK